MANDTATVRLENMTRSVFRFPAVTRGPGTKDRPGRLGIDEANTIVLGDSADRHLPAGLTSRNPRCPDPVWTGSIAVVNAMTDQVGKMLMDLVRAGDITMQVDGRVVTGREAA